MAEASGVELDAAEACYKQAQALKGDLYDPLISLANLEFERGKLAMNLAIASLRQVFLILTSLPWDCCLLMSPGSLELEVTSWP